MLSQTMTEYRQTYSPHGRLQYLPDHVARDTLPDTSRTFFQARRRRPHRIHIANVQPDPSPLKRNSSRRSVGPIIDKLATRHDHAKRFLRSFIAPPVANIDGETPTPVERKRRSLNLESLGRLRSGPSPTRSDDSSSSGTSSMRSSAYYGNSTAGLSVLDPALAEPATPSQAQTWPTKSMSSMVKALGEEKPLAAGTGIAVGIALAEPVLFLQGFEPSDTSSERSTAMLRGSLHLRISKSTKVKSVSLNFCGRALTKWPEGIPPKKVDFEEKNIIMKHCWPFFNAKFPNAESGSCADHVELWKTPEPTSNSRLPFGRDSPNTSSTNLTVRDHRRLSLQVNQSRSFGKGESAPGAPTVNQKGYRTFLPGDYIYNFELPLDSHLPESIDVELGSVKYELEAIVERAGAFRANLVGTKEVTLIRAPSEGSLEQVEPIAISRNWEDQLHYDIVISGKSFPLGAQIPIAFKLTPLAKVQCHRIKVFVTENVEYFCNNKRVHRMEPARKIQLFEKRADSPATSTFPGSNMRVVAGGGVPYDQRAAAARGEQVQLQDPNNLLGDLNAGSSIGPTEMEFNVQLPGCNNLKDKDKTQRLHFDTTYQNIQVHHWIKIVMRLSRVDANDPTKRRHFEISIDSPFHILSCRATQANIALPAYTSPEPVQGDAEVPDCSCPGAIRRRSSPSSFVPSLNALNNNNNNNNNNRHSDFIPDSASTPQVARPEQAHIGGPVNATLQRPIHMLRQPSFNPPAFDEELPPPPLETPPPQYDSIASPTSGLADYFSRLSDAYDDSDPEEGGLTRRPSRMHLPLTPGSRINRSMDEPRTWLPASHFELRPTS